MSNVPDSFPSSVEVDGFTVYKLRLSEYALVFDKLQKLPALLSEFTEVSNAAILSALPRLVATALPEVLEILAIATRKTVAELDETMSPATAVHCVKALFTVNDFFGLWEEMKNAIPAELMEKGTKAMKKT